MTNYVNAKFKSMNDISSRSDIEQLVNRFYGKVLKDDLLSPFFKRLNFEIHLPKMVDFWAFVLLDEVGYKTNVTDKHQHMKLSKEHFERWISLFEETVNEMFTGEKSKLAVERAKIVGMGIMSKI